LELPLLQNIQAMKKVLCTLLLGFLVLPVGAQEEVKNAKEPKEVQLNEVTVEAARVVTKVDGLLIIPSDTQRKASTNGYSLLSKLSLPHVRVDPVSHAVTALMNNGAVQLRLNGVVIDKEEMLSLDPKLVKNIDFIDNPGVRYGENIAYVIDIKTKRNTGGYVVGVDLTHTLTAWNTDNTIYTKLNHKNSELSFSYNFSYRDFRKGRTSETTDYLLNNGSHYLVTRKQTAGRDRALGNRLQMKYSLADSASYVFQATLSAFGMNTPSCFSDYQLMDGTLTQAYQDVNRSSRFTPVIDLYFFHKIGNHQSVTANVVGTAIYTDKYVRQGEGTPYTYNVDGDTWSVQSEAIYENKLKPFTLSAGLQHMQKYTRNHYTGDVDALNKMHLGELYFFSELKGKWQQLSYSLGVGVANKTYSQASYDYDYWTFRPKVTLKYMLLKGLNVGYAFQTYRRVSPYAMVSDMRIRNNSREWTVGNPALKPSRVIQHTMSLDYYGDRVSNSMYMEYRRNLHCNMARYERTPADEFLYSQQNMGSISLFYVQDNLKYELIPEHLSVTLTGGINRCFNVCSLYRHYLTSYTYGGSVQAYLGKWTLQGYADNGWRFLEGERLGHNGAFSYLAISYSWGNCSLSLDVQHVFQQHPRMYKSQLLNAYLHKSEIERNRDLGNMIGLNFTWRLSKGKAYKQIEKRIERQEDKQTGIM
jgi:hypothetical protein